MIQVRSATLILICSLASTAVASAGFQESQVYQQGWYGYHTFRIPAIVVTNAGTVLAFAEGRVNSGSDTGNINLVLRRSFDNGQTWAGLQVVHDDGSQTIGNPAPVVDRATGVIWVLFCRNNAEVFATYSTNDGQSWATPANITADVADPAWYFVATGPVHGFQMANGRLVVPSYRNDTASPSDVRSYMIYSDDYGATWSGGGFPASRCGESTALETEDGRIYLNARSWIGVNRRASAFSSNGGLSWGPLTYDVALPDPPAQGSVIRYTSKFEDDRNRLLFSNPPGLTREQLSVRVSYDEGLTWNHGRMVYPNETGYSDIAILPTAEIGVLYERGVSAYYESIWFARFDRDWLESVPDHVLWNFDEQNSGLASTSAGAIEDLGGHEFHAQAVGSPPPIYVDGAAAYGTSSALQFSSGSDAVRWIDSGERALDFSSCDSFTLEAVLRTTAHGSGGASGAGSIIAKDWGASLPSWWLRVENGVLRFLISDDQGVTNAVTSSVEVNDGQWHHVAAVRDRENLQLRVYLDHLLVGTATDTTTGTLANDQDIRVGGFGNASREFVGAIDQVRISRGVLPPGAFVQATVATRVAAQWSFEEAEPGDVAELLHGAIRDASGNRRHATVAGAAPPVYAVGAVAYGQDTALHVDAATAAVRVEDRGADDLDFASDASFTLEAVVRTTQTNSGAIVAKDADANLPGWRVVD